MLRQDKLTPLRAALAYALIAALWIVVSDRLLAVWLHGAEDTEHWIGSVKGIFFVVCTAGALFGLLARQKRLAERDAALLADEHERSERRRRYFTTQSAINGHLVRDLPRPEIARAICGALLDPGQFAYAWIGRHDPAGNRIVAVGEAGTESVRRHLAAHPDLEQRCAQRLVAVATRGEVEVGPSILGPIPGSDALLSCALLPFRTAQGETFVIAAGACEPNFFTGENLVLVRQLADDLRHGFDVVAEREARTAVQQALRESESRYRMLAEHSHDVIWTFGLDGTLRFVSPSVRPLLGYSVDEILPRPFPSCFTPASARRITFELGRARAHFEQTGQLPTLVLELEHLRRDGTTVWTELVTTDFNPLDRTTPLLLGVTRNIEQRRQAENALTHQAARYRHLLDIATEGIYILDPAGRLLEANESFLRQRGLDRTRLGGLRVEDWEIAGDGGSATQLATIGTDMVTFEARHRRTDGTVFAVEVCARRVELDGLPHLYCSARDITERRASEQQALRAQRLESVGLLASGIAHDLNNVLTPILLSVDILGLRYRSAEDREVLAPVEAAARRGSTIVQQILTFARGAEGERVVIEPMLLLKELMHLIRETFPRNITHRLELAPGTKSVLGDPTQLHQVLLNLAVNARDAMPEGGTLTVRVRNEIFTDTRVQHVPGSRPGHFVCFSVIDTGTGIAPAVLDHLFEPFFTTKPRGKGTGLGLSTVHGLVRGHGGFVQVLSEVGKGAEFRVFIPQAEKTVSVVAAPAVRPHSAGAGLGVLVVDDEEAIVAVVAAILKRHGYQVHRAPDGAAALESLAALGNRIQAVITDVMMPRLDGIRLTEETRRLRPGLPIIVMSGLIEPDQDTENRKRLRDLGVTTFVGKPCSESELLDALDRTLHAAA